MHPSDADTWRRNAEAVAIRIEAGFALDPDAPDGRRELPLPSGPVLRLLLAQIFSAALRSDSPQATLGDSLGTLARAIGIEGSEEELRAQMERVSTARIGIAFAGGPELMVFDARGVRARADSTVWRDSIRLNERFFAGLKRNAVSLDRQAALALRDSAAALDAYAWMASGLQGDEDEPISLPWEALRHRFGEDDRSVDAFRPHFEAALRRAAAVCPGVSLHVGDNGVVLRRAAPASEPSAATPSAGHAAPAAEAAPIPEPDRSPEAATAPETLPSPSPAEARRDAAATSQSPPPPLAGDAETPPADPPRIAEPRDGATAPARPGRLTLSPRPAEPPPAPAPRAAPPAPAPVRADVPPASPARPAPPARPTPPPRQAAPRTGPMDERLGLMPHLTGLGQAVWIRRGSGLEPPLLEIMPPGRYDPGRRSVVALEPIFLQVSGTLHPRELERLAAWTAANSDLIEAYWSGEIASNEDAVSQVRKVPAARW